MKIGKGFKVGMKVLSEGKWETVKTPKVDGGFISKNGKEFNLGDVVDGYKAR